MTEKSNKISPFIFREYDIRGHEEKEGELNDAVFELIGRAYGTYLARKGVKLSVAGGDNRKTSEKYLESAIKGINSAGVDVVDIGTVTTPMMYWAQFRFATPGGIMVTASHNPKGWNGAKLASGFADTLGGAELKNIYNMIEKGDFNDEDTAGSARKEDIKKAYFEDLLGKVDIKRRFKIVVNTGNGTAGYYAPDLMRKAGMEIVDHNNVPNPDYPDYTPNPADTEMIKDTARVVAENNADMGLAFDGDGDRLGLVSEKGHVILPDRYLSFLARGVLAEKPGAKIIFDVKSSLALSEDIKKHGGVPVMSATGHSNIKKMMQKEKAELAGEFSGHIFFKHGYYGFDDALFAALKLLEYVSKQEKTLSELDEDIPNFVSSPGYNTETPDDKKFEVVGNIKEEFIKEGYDVIEIDGARVNFKRKDGSFAGWGLIRASNTSNNLSLRFEAKTQKELEEIEDIFIKKLSRYKFVSKNWKPA